MKRFFFLGVILFLGIGVVSVVKSVGSDKAGGLLNTDTFSEQQENSDDPFQATDKMMQEFMKKFDNSGSLFGKMDDDDFFKNFHDPFKEMERLRKEMRSNFRNFDSMFGTSGLTTNEDMSLKTSEDDQNVYYDIRVGDIKPENLKVDINGDTVTVTGNVSKSESLKDNGFQGKQKFYSQFVRTFPVPSGVDVNKSDVRIEDKNIEIKFPKN